MARALLAVLVASLPMLAAHAAPAGDTGPFVASPLPAGALPVPPLAATPRSFAPAPVPDPDAERPRDRQAETPRTQVAPRLYTDKDQRPGDGYVQGSGARYDQGRERVTPGVNLRVPLE